MSGLAAVLAGHEPAGVHRWASALDIDDVRRAVEHADFSFATVDTVGLATKRDTLLALGRALDFPPHYGANLDALHDSLRDRTGPTVLLWEGWGTFARTDPRAFLATVDVLATRPPGESPLEVLLRGPGPEGVVPLLD